MRVITRTREARRQAQGANEYTTIVVELPPAPQELEVSETTSLRVLVGLVNTSSHGLVYSNHGLRQLVGHIMASN